SRFLRNDHAFTIGKRSKIEESVSSNSLEPRHLFYSQAIQEQVLSLCQIRQTRQATMRKQQINPFEDKRIHTDPLIECQFPQLFIRRVGQIRRQLLFLLTRFPYSCGGYSLLGHFRCYRLLREGKRVQGTPGFSGHVIFPIFRSSQCHRSRTSWAAVTLQALLRWFLHFGLRSDRVTRFQSPSSLGRPPPPHS